MSIRDRMIYWLLIATCRMDIGHVWVIARTQGVEVVRICDICGKIRKPKKERR